MSKQATLKLSNCSPFFVGFLKKSASSTTTATTTTTTTATTARLKVVERSRTFLSLLGIFLYFFLFVCHSSFKNPKFKDGLNRVFQKFSSIFYKILSKSFCVEKYYYLLQITLLQFFPGVWLRLDCDQFNYSQIRL